MSYVRVGLMRKFWTAKVGGSVVGLAGVRRVSGGTSSRISRSAPQAELGAKRSTARLKYARHAVTSTNKVCEG